MPRTPAGPFLVSVKTEARSPLRRYQTPPTSPRTPSASWAHRRTEPAFVKATCATTTSAGRQACRRNADKTRHFYPIRVSMAHCRRRLELWIVQHDRVWLTIAAHGRLTTAKPPSSVQLRSPPPASLLQMGTFLVAPILGCYRMLPCGPTCECFGAFAGREYQLHHPCAACEGCPGVRPRTVRAFA